MQQIADELFDLWKEAKDGEWDDIRWEGLSAKEKDQFNLTAKRIIKIAREEIALRKQLEQVEKPE